MGFNFLEIIKKYYDFKRMLDQSGKDPRELLEKELKKRGTTPQQLEQLLQKADELKKIIGIK